MLTISASLCRFCVTELRLRYAHIRMSADESDLHSSSPDPQPSPSIAQRLYSDALLSILQFLDLLDVIAAHGTCCAWRNAAHRAPSHKITLRCSPADLPAFTSSAFRHHVIAFVSRESNPPIGFEGMAALRAFPALSRIAAKFNDAALSSIVKDSVDWPARLQTIDLKIEVEEPSSDKTQALLECMCSMQALTSIRLIASERPISLQPLLQLPLLRELTLDGFDASLVYEDYAVFKQLGSLERLSVNGERWTAVDLDLLCSPPHALSQLHTLDMRWTTLGPLQMEALLHLPALTSIQPYYHNEGTLPFLSRIPHLRVLDLWRSSDDLSNLSDLSRCSGLTQLSLWHCAVSETTFAELCRSLSALKKLTLFGISDLGLAENDSALQCVTSLRLLERLQFHRCEMITLKHILQADLARLPLLRHLSVSLDHAELEESRKLLEPPSLLLPQLTSLWVGTNPSADEQL